MASRKMNVLVYSGNGSTVESVRHCLYSLRRLLSSRYAVIPIAGETVIQEPWAASCALLVFPGGADLGYCRTLNGEGNRKISQYIRRGGSYLGLCAGAYYGSQYCEFEVGNKKLEVTGERELAFFPGTCRGCAFEGFVYHSEGGTRAAELRVEKASFAETTGTVPEVFRCYYNGGGVFVDAKSKTGVEVLATYTEPTSVDGGDGEAAVVYCKVGEGAAVLTGPHPEFAAVNLDRNEETPGYSKIVDQLVVDDQRRTDFLKACLTKLGLEVNNQQSGGNPVPSLSQLHLSSSQTSNIVSLLASLREEGIIAVDENDREEYIKGENDTFHLQKQPFTWSASSQPRSSPSTEEGTDDLSGDLDRMTLDYNTVTKQLLPHTTSLPACKETPYFNHHAFFSNLAYYQNLSKLPSCETNFGKILMYGEVVTSTNTMLEKNHSLLRNLPTGFTATATLQIAGRGRGSNVWVSPAGSLVFSTCIRHPMPSTASSTPPVVFIQYLTAMAVLDGIRTYDSHYRAYANLPIKLKWPNDIYAEDPVQPARRAGERKRFTKIGGILVNSSYAGKEFLLVVGVGLNTTNAAPTTSLTALLPSGVPPFSPEKLLARILTAFESLYRRFLAAGEFTDEMETSYRRDWLHEGQLVTLESEGGTRGRIVGLEREFGQLIVEQVGWGDIGTGRRLVVSGDGNGFDFMKGLIRRKG